MIGNIKATPKLEGFPIVSTHVFIHEIEKGVREEMMEERGHEKALKNKKFWIILIFNNESFTLSNNNWDNLIL